MSTVYISNILVLDTNNYEGYPPSTHREIDKSTQDYPLALTKCSVPNDRKLDVIESYKIVKSVKLFHQDFDGFSFFL